MKRLPALSLLLAASLSVSTAHAARSTASKPTPQALTEVSTEARQLHERLLTLDSHLDTPAWLALPGWNVTERHSLQIDLSQVDVPRMREGGLDGGFFVIYTDPGERTPQAQRQARDHGLARLMTIRETIAARADELTLALNADDAARIAATGKRAIYISMENASPLAADPALLDFYYRQGLRMLGIVHIENNEFADSSTAAEGPEWNGLSPAGKALIQEANRLGLIVDLSHASDAAFDQALEVSRTPIVLSHTSSKAIFDHPRNIDDERIRKLAAKGGVIQVNAFPGYLIEIPDHPERKKRLRAATGPFWDGTADTAEKRQALANEFFAAHRAYPMRRPDFEDFMRHLLHIIRVAGPEHVGLGADFDGAGGNSSTGLEDVATLPRITARLLAEGFSEEQIAAFWSGNLLRVMRQVEAAREQPLR